MKKLFFVFLYFLLVIDISFSVQIESLKEIVTKKIFCPDFWPKVKQDFSQILINNKFPEDLKELKQVPIKKINLINLSFNGWKFSQCCFEDLDLRHVDLSNTHFERCSFKDIQFNGKDLSTATFIECGFDSVDFREANLINTTLKDSSFINKILFEGAILAKDFIFSHEVCGFSAQEFVQFYSRLMNQGETDKAEGLNKIISYLCFNLYNAHLENLNLKNINFYKVNLLRAHLKGVNLTGACLKKASLIHADLREVFLSESLQIPNYENPNELFKEWKKYRTEYQPILNAQFNFVKDISNIELKAIEWKGGDFSNSDLSGAQLNNIDFTETNLSDASLFGTNLKEAILNRANLTCANLGQANLLKASLIGADLSGATLLHADLREVQLSESVRILHYQHINEIFKLWKKADPQTKLEYDKLLHTQVPFFDGIPNKKLKKLNWRNQDFSHSNLSRAQLQNIDLTGINFQRSILYLTNLEGANLTGGDLRFTYINQTNLKRTTLTKINLEYSLILQGLRLSEHFTLPENGGLPYSDEKLVNQYRICRDEDAKKMLEQILIAKRLISENQNEERSPDRNILE